MNKTQENFYDDRVVDCGIPSSSNSEIMLDDEFLGLTEGGELAMDIFPIESRSCGD